MMCPTVGHRGWDVFEQLITQSCEALETPVLCEEFHHIAEASEAVQTIFTCNPITNTINGHSQTCVFAVLDHNMYSVFLFVLGDDTTLWGKRKEMNDAALRTKKV